MREKVRHIDRNRPTVTAETTMVNRRPSPSVTLPLLPAVTERNGLWERWSRRGRGDGVGT